MKLKSFGCSFVYGSDLSDDPKGRCDSAPSKSAWPCLIAQKRGWDYQCFAWPGSGNLRILNSVLSAAAKKENSFFVIGWTWIDRFDYVNAVTDQWATTTPTDTDQSAKNYYRDHHSEFRDKFVTLTAIKGAIDTLNQKQIPFFMTYMDDLIFDQTWHTDPAIIDLQNFVRPWLYNWENQNFIKWSQSQGFEISKNLHPLDLAHVASAALFDQHIF